jgi:hypothetical protein
VTEKAGRIHGPSPASTCDRPGYSGRSESRSARHGPSRGLADGAALVQPGPPDALPGYSPNRGPRRGLCRPTRARHERRRYKRERLRRTVRPSGQWTWSRVWATCCSPTRTPTSAALGTIWQPGLVWAREEGYVTAKPRRANGDVDRPLLPSEQARLVEDATRLALGCPVRCLGYWTPEFERG